jgi:hypothetical protein
MHFLEGEEAKKARRSMKSRGEQDKRPTFASRSCNCHTLSRFKQPIVYNCLVNLVLKRYKEALLTELQAQKHSTTQSHSLLQRSGL